MSDMNRYVEDLENQNAALQTEIRELKDRRCETCNLWDWNADKDENNYYPGQGVCGDDTFDVELRTPPEYCCSNWEKKLG